MSVNLEIFVLYYNTPEDESKILLKRNLSDIYEELKKIAAKFKLVDEIPSMESIQNNINSNSFYKIFIDSNFYIYIQKSSIIFDIKADSELFKITGKVVKK